MSWTVLRAVCRRPLFRLSPRIDVFRTSSLTHQSHRSDILPADLRISKLFEKNLPIAAADWTKIRQNFLKSPTINTSNVDQVIVDFCERNGNALDNAMSYVEFLSANDIPVDQRLRLKVIQLYIKMISDGPVAEEMQAKIIALCDSVMNASSTLKKPAAISLFMALSSTSEWRRCIDLIDKYDIKCSATSVPTLSLLAANAFWEDDPSIGWQLLDKIVEMDFAPQCISFLAYWNHCTLHHDDKFTERIEQMLEFIGMNDVLVSREVLNGLQTTIESVEMKPTEIDFRGNCAVCRQALDDVRLSSHEFRMLKKEFEKTSLSKENILAHSSQSELIRFKQHVNKKRIYHYVIDGLNVGLNVPNNYLEQAKSLAQIVEYFVKRNKRVLVIGRKHMNNWPERQMNYIKMNAEIFFTADESDDDPYLLYATLVSGERTDFVSRDQMRAYSQRLSPAGRLLFKQWQKQHQNFFLSNDDRSENNLKVLRPFRYKHFCHKNKQQQWHVPFVDKPAPKLGRYLEADVQWACFKFEITNKVEDVIDGAATN